MATLKGRQTHAYVRNCSTVTHFLKETPWWILMRNNPRTEDGALPERIKQHASPNTSRESCSLTRRLWKLHFPITPRFCWTVPAPPASLQSVLRFPWRTSTSGGLSDQSGQWRAVHATSTWSGWWLSPQQEAICGSHSSIVQLLWMSDPIWLSTVPIPTSLGSVSSTNGRLKPK